jgi:RES domain
MYYQIGAGDLYRVTGDNTVWPDPVRGYGAFYLHQGGNRYNAARQVTVSCSEDPWVAICEAAYYQALKLRDAIASSLINAVNYPFRSEHLFWSFRINPLPPVIDLESPVAAALFQYSPHVLTNPGQNYSATQSISNAVCYYVPPVGSPDPLPEGILAPSVRTPRVRTYQPKQLALFVVQRQGLLPYDQRSALTAKMRLEIEFFAAPPAGGPVSFQSSAIHWTKPKFRLSAIAVEPSIGPVPAMAARPGGRPIPLNRWLRLSVCY